MSDSYDNIGIVGRGWFKPAVAAWFGVLAAAGMWFMPPSVHASIMQATGLGGLSPLFAPPVAYGGILLLCAIAGLIGFLLGFFIAGRFARAAAPRAFAPGFEIHDESSWNNDETVAVDQPRRRRVFSAREDIGEEGIAISAAVDDETSYEEEFSIEDIPPVTPEDDFDTVFAEMEPDYVPPEEVDHADAVDTEAGVDEPFEYEAEFVEVDDAELEPPPLEEHEPARIQEPQIEIATDDGEPEVAESPETALGDMSLAALLDRLEGAIDTHRKMVDTSERASEEAPPQPVPLTREMQAPSSEADEEPGLPEASDDDPVIAFLRREARRRMPQQAANEEAVEPDPIDPGRSSHSDAHAALRSALDRLGQTGRRD